MVGLTATTGWSFVVECWLTVVADAPPDPARSWMVDGQGEGGEGKAELELGRMTCSEITNWISLSYFQLGEK